MDSKDWYNCGAKIGDLVQSAIDSNNFKQLNEAITKTINETMEAVQSSISRSAGKPGQGMGPGKYGEAAERYGSFRQPGRAYDEAQARANVQDIFASLRGNAGNRGQATHNASGRIGSIFSMVAGFGMAIVSGLLGLSMLFLNWLSGFAGFGFSALFFFVLAAIFALVGAKGGGYRSRMKRLEQYLKIMDGRDTVTLEELAGGTGKSVKEVQEDIRTMIREGMFASEAYLDAEGTALMTSRKAYRQYQDTMKAYRQRQAEQEQQKRMAHLSEQERAKAEKDLERYSEETRKILWEGREFIRHIHEANEKIPGKEISDKLYRLEQVVTTIFDQVAKKPDSAPDLHRMMSYYLPITRKLVDAYVELDEAGIEGENIVKTRNEIEMSLDTINGAFETFLDSFYQDTAWDISSDISAMTTMMARDGLTGNGDFGRVRKVGNDVNRAEKAAAREAGLSREEETAPEEKAHEGSGKVHLEFGDAQAAPQQQASSGGGISLSFGSGAGAAAAAQQMEEER